MNLVVGWRDIIRAEANSLTRIEVKVPVSEKITTEFDAIVLNNLRGDIGRGRAEGETDRQVYRKMLVQYHPDLYVGEDAKVIDLSREYTQALGALKDNGEINP